MMKIFVKQHFSPTYCVPSLVECFASGISSKEAVEKKLEEIFGEADLVCEGRFEHICRQISKKKKKHLQILS